MSSVESTVVSAADFRSTCALFPTGVTIVTRRMPNGRPYGMTVSSFTSVSLDPPLILVCIDKGAVFLHELAPQLPFAVNILSDRQVPLAGRFADRNEDDRFAGVDWKGGWNGVPLLEGVVASLICSLDQVVEAGDHLILIALVHHIDMQEDGRPVVWCRRGYHPLTDSTS